MANNINWGKIYEKTAWGIGVITNTISWGKIYSNLAGVLPSFALNFDTIADDFTFTRNSFATRVNENGLIETVTNLGSEQVVNGDFTDGTNNWIVASGGTISVVNEQLILEGDNDFNFYARQEVIGYEVGKTYQLKIDVAGGTTSKMFVSVFGEGIIINESPIILGETTVNFTITGGSDGSRFLDIVNRDDDGVGDTLIINSVSVKEVIEDDIPRIDYSTGEAAFLLEPQSTNLYLNSENLSTQNVTTLASTYTVSFRGTGTITFSGTHTGSLVGTGSMDLVSTTFLATAGTLISTVSGDVKYAQIEELSYATSYIPTEGSTVTRSAETCVNATPTINSEEGVLYAEFNVLDSANSYKMIEINDGISGSDRVVIYAFGGNIYGLVKSNGVTNLNIFSIKTVTDFNKVAVKWGTDETALWVNGVEINTGSGSTFNADVLDNLGFVGAANKYLYGNTKDLKIYDKALTDEELTELTTI